MRVREIYEAATDILYDRCPKDQRFHQCRMGEDPDGDCYSCWQCYLWHLENGWDVYAGLRRNPA